MKVAIAQINSTVGDFEKNFLLISDYIKKAKRRSADLVVFPELALCGYPPEDLLFKNAFIQRNSEYILKIAKISKGITAVFGAVVKDGSSVFNSLVAVRNGKILGVYNKIKLPNYSVFDEKRYFTSGDEVFILDQDAEKICFTICEDIWQDDIIYKKAMKKEPFSLMVNLSCSPYNHGKLKQRERLIVKRAKDLNVPLVYCNIVGGQDELVFDGGSLVVDDKGNIILHAKRFEEDMIIYNTNGRYKPKTVKDDALENSYKALCLGVRDYVHKNGFQKVIIGLSGGIDSALVAAIATAALGRWNVFGVTMPSKYSSEATFNDALKLAKNLGIRCRVVPIKNMVNTFIEEMDPVILGHEKWYDLACQNMQARMRGNILMTISNRYGSLVLNTGNKSEVSVGYCTLYGDMVGGYSVLKDVYKTNVFKLARYINKIASKELIPVSTIKRPPSAELKSDQKDEDELLPYSVLDKILKCYIESDLHSSEIVELGYKKADVQRVISLVDTNEYKRRQAPPGIRITPKAFGKDRRMPITNRFK